MLAISKEDYWTPTSHESQKGALETGANSSFNLGPWLGGRGTQLSKEKANGKASATPS